MKLIKTSGIYKIINLINNKIYIGSAINFNLRYRKHISDLKNNNHCNKKLQNGWNKHGEGSFDFVIIEQVIDKTKLLEREQYYLDNLKPEYNICKIAGNTLGVKVSDETKKKISETLTDKFSGVNSFNYKGGYTKPKNKLEINKTDIYVEEVIETRQSLKSGKTILQYDSNMVLIQEWVSIKKASDTLKISRTAIKRCFEGKDRHAGFFIWRLKGEEFVVHNFRVNTILQLNEKLEIVGEFPQIVVAAEKLKINRKYIGLAIKTGKTYCGFYWKLKN
jgi:group I intron endonuclease